MTMNLRGGSDSGIDSGVSSHVERENVPKSCLTSDKRRISAAVYVPFAAHLLVMSVASVAVNAATGRSAGGDRLR